MSKKLLFDTLTGSVSVPLTISILIGCVIPVTLGNVIPSRVYSSSLAIGVPASAVTCSTKVIVLPGGVILTPFNVTPSIVVGT